MERLTKRVDGIAVLESWAIDKDPVSIIQRLCNHLAAYEDTGLEPGEIKDNMEMFRAYRHICAGHEPEHIRDLLQAENEGRMVVLPCKVGDMVYEVCNNTDACSGCRNYKGIYGSGESWCTRIDDVDLRSYPNIAERPLCEKQFMEVVDHKPKADWIFNHRNDFGKTVFLTREEAEAALSGKGISE